MPQRVVGRSSERVALRHVGQARVQAQLREPDGQDELSVDGVDTRAAAALLSRLIEPAALDVGALSASDRDALLAALHRRLWGDRILASLDCAACGAPYDLDFALSALQRQLAQGMPAFHCEAPRQLALADGHRIKLPSVAEEDAAAGSAPADARQQLLARVTGQCEVVEVEQAEQVEQAAQVVAQVVAQLEALAPLLDVDLDTRCAECGHAQLARFDVQSHLLQRLLDERELLLADLHTLAGRYGWSSTEILALPRSLRQSLVQRLSSGPAWAS